MDTCQGTHTEHSCPLHGERFGRRCLCGGRLHTPAAGPAHTQVPSCQLTQEQRGFELPGSTEEDPRMRLSAQSARMVQGSAYFQGSFNICPKRLYRSMNFHVFHQLSWYLLLKFDNLVSKQNISFKKFGFLQCSMLNGFEPLGPTSCVADWPGERPEPLGGCSRLSVPPRYTSGSTPPS